MYKIINMINIKTHLNIHIQHPNHYIQKILIIIYNNKNMN